MEELYNGLSNDVGLQVVSISGFEGTEEARRSDGFGVHLGDHISHR